MVKVYNPTGDTVKQWASGVRYIIPAGGNIEVEEEGAKRLLEAQPQLRIVGADNVPDLSDKIIQAEDKSKIDHSKHTTKTSRLRGLFGGGKK